MFLRRLQFVTAQLGRKPGKGEALARLLAENDLPGGPWVLLDQRTWRTGETGSATAWGERARQAGGRLPGGSAGLGLAVSVAGGGPPGCQAA